MNQKLKIIFTLALLICVLHYRSMAQQTLNVSGQSVKINGLRFEYSIGEMTLISTEKNSKITVTQGVLQPDVPATKIAEQKNVIAAMSQTNVKVYPNPTENMLFIESYENEDATLSFELFDVSGRVISSEKINKNAGNNKHSIDLKSHTAGTYFLMLHKKSVSGQQENFSFKIQKVN